MKTKSYRLNSSKVEISNLKKNDDTVQFDLNNISYRGKFLSRDGQVLTLELNEKIYQLSYKNGLTRINGHQIDVSKEVIGRGSKSDDDHGGLNSPMPGKILKISVKEGEDVVKGTTLVVMEAMKMEHSLKAPCDCTVDKFFFKEGELVEGDIELVAITPKDQE